MNIHNIITQLPHSCHMGVRTIEKKIQSLTASVTYKTESYLGQKHVITHANVNSLIKRDIRKQGGICLLWWEGVIIAKRYFAS